MMLVSLFEETRRAHAIAIVGSEGCASQRRVAKATELNRHTTRMKMRGSVVSLSFIFFFSHPPEDKNNIEKEMCIELWDKSVVCATRVSVSVV